jgi:PAS domain S-box-containing protein
MNAIIEHVWTPDELAPQGSHGIDNVTAEELELLQQKNEAVLRRANAHLEQRVRARTAELAQTNAALQAEIQAHKQVEHERTQLLVREQALRRELEVAVATLRTSEQRFRRLFDANIIGIAFSDFSGHEIEVNDAFLDLIGYTREDLQAGCVRWNMMTPPEYRHLDAHAEAELKARGVCTPFEKEYLRKDGHRVPVLVGVAWLASGPPAHRATEGHDRAGGPWGDHRDDYLSPLSDLHPRRIQGARANFQGCLSVETSSQATTVMRWGLEGSEPTGGSSFNHRTREKGVWP